MHQEMRQAQKLLMKQEMKCALHLLKLPVMELGSYIEKELEENPVLEVMDAASGGGEIETPTESSLYDQLWEQARQVFDAKELPLAEEIIGSIESSGFLTESVEEMAKRRKVSPGKMQKILRVVHSFEPKGIGARDVQEALLLQLKEGLARKIIQECFDDLVCNHISLIKSKLGCSLVDLQKALKCLAKLNFHPGSERGHAPFVVPDLFIQEEVIVNQEPIPEFRIHAPYLQLARKAEEAGTRRYLLHKIYLGNCLLRAIAKRNETLEKIGQALLQHQSAFFQEDGPLQPMTMVQLKEELQLHESTIGRAVFEKYVACSSGLFPLRSFFVSSVGVHSSDETKLNILKIIRQEDKNCPLSDEKIVQKLHAMGIICARRTIVKFREELRIANCHLRKYFS